MTFWVGQKVRFRDEPQSGAFTITRISDSLVRLKEQPDFWIPTYALEPVDPIDTLIDEIEHATKDVF